jgi:hypothetical protein
MTDPDLSLIIMLEAELQQAKKRIEELETSPPDPEPEIEEAFEDAQEAYWLVYEFFKDPVKTKAWFKTPNPGLGDIRPMYMLCIGRGKKLLRWIAFNLEENRIECRMQAGEQNTGNGENK